ncbi:MAG: hypothetical protein ACJ8AB_02835 [Gemmatimonadaceae bacterium]
MTGATAGIGAPPRRWGKTALALLAGIVVGVVLSLGTDQILHVLGIYPPWGQTMSDGLFAVATGYRIIYNIIGSYVAARLAPNRPMWHAMVLGVLGLLVGGAGAAATWNSNPPLGPHWYGIAVALISIPCAWIGGLLAERRG